jgi:transposase
LRERGLSYEAIAAQVGLSRTGVFNICQRFARAGLAGLASQRRGPASGHGRLLPAEQEVALRALICAHTPDELGLPFALWQRAAVQELIRQRCGVRLAVRTVGKYLARWGFTAQKPRCARMMCVAALTPPAAARRWCGSAISGPG